MPHNRHIICLKLSPHLLAQVRSSQSRENSCEIGDTIVVNSARSMGNDASTPEVSNAATNRNQASSGRRLDRDKGVLSQPAHTRKSQSSNSMMVTPDPEIKAVRFASGDQSLREVPDYILTRLKKNCAIFDYEYPSCTFRPWGMGRTLDPSVQGHYSFFVAGTEDRLHSAAYLYGDRQFVVVQQKINGDVLDGRGLNIVYYGDEKSMQNPRGMRDIWRVWNPSWEIGDLDQTAPSVEADFVSLVSGADTAADFQKRLSAEQTNLSIVHKDQENSVRRSHDNPANDTDIEDIHPVNDETSVAPASSSSATEYQMTRRRSYRKVIDPRDSSPLPSSDEEESNYEEDGSDDHGDFLPQPRQVSRKRDRAARVDHMKSWSDALETTSEDDNATPAKQRRRTATQKRRRTSVVNFVNAHGVDIKLERHAKGAFRKCCEIWGEAQVRSDFAPFMPTNEIVRSWNKLSKLARPQKRSKGSFECHQVKHAIVKAQYLRLKADHGTHSCSGLEIEMTLADLERAFTILEQGPILIDDLKKILARDGYKINSPGFIRSVQNRSNPSSAISGTTPHQDLNETQLQHAGIYEDTLTHSPATNTVASHNGPDSVRVSNGCHNQLPRQQQNTETNQLAGVKSLHASALGPQQRSSTFGNSTMSPSAGVSLTPTSATDQNTFLVGQEVVEKLAELNRTATFVFKKDEQDERPRKRPFKFCDSSKKLFAQFVTHAPTMQDVLVLQARIEGRPDVVNLFKGDTEDFERLKNIVDEKEQAGMCGIKVIITAVDVG